MKMTESELILSQLIDIAHKTNNVTGKFDKASDNEIFLELFEKLYYQSAKDNFFWQYCPFSVYEKRYEESKSRYLEQYPDSSEREFANEEWFEISEYYGEESAVGMHYGVVDKEGYKFNFEIIGGHGCVGFVFIQKSNLPIYRNIELTQKRKIEFLESKFSRSTTSDQSKPGDSFRDMLQVDDSVKDDLIEMLKRDFKPRRDKNNATILAALNETMILRIKNGDMSLIHRAIGRDIFNLGNISGLQTYYKSYADSEANLGLVGKVAIPNEDILRFVDKYQGFKRSL